MVLSLPLALFTLSFTNCGNASWGVQTEPPAHNIFRVSASASRWHAFIFGFVFKVDRVLFSGVVVYGACFLAFFGLTVINDGITHRPWCGFFTIPYRFAVRSACCIHGRAGQALPCSSLYRCYHLKQGWAEVRKIQGLVGFKKRPRNRNGTFATRRPDTITLSAFGVGAKNSSSDTIPLYCRGQVHFG